MIKHRINNILDNLNKTSTLLKNKFPDSRKNILFLSFLNYNTVNKICPMRTFKALSKLLGRSIANRHNLYYMPVSSEDFLTQKDKSEYIKKLLNISEVSPDLFIVIGKDLVNSLLDTPYSISELISFCNNSELTKVYSSKLGTFIIPFASPQDINWKNKYEFNTVLKCLSKLRRV